MSTTAPSRLLESWDWIDSQRTEIASALSRLGNELQSADRRTLRRLANWFAHKANYEDAIARPDVLAICVALIKINCSHVAEDSISRIDRAVRIGFSSIAKSRSTRGRYLTLFLYPGLLILALMLLSVFFSFYIVPEFQTMIEEFGVQLPQMTTAVFNLAAIIRFLWTPFLTIAIGTTVFCLVANQLTQHRREIGDNWLSTKLKSGRKTAASWAWHMALLIEAGFNIPNAVSIAGKSHGKIWLKNSTKNWSKQNEETESIAPSSNAKLFGGRFQLLETTLKLDQAEAQTSLFRETAIYYWTDDRVIAEWWMRWVVSLLFWLSVLGIIVTLLALYGPLLALISGLTGW